MKTKTTKQTSILNLMLSLSLCIVAPVNSWAGSDTESIATSANARSGVSSASAAAAAAASGLTAAGCAQRLVDLNNACNTKAADATSSCDDSQNSGLATAQQVAVTLGQQVSTSIAAACSTMGTISQVANAATAAYQMSCSSAVSSCTSSCNTALQYYNSCATAGFPSASAQAALKDTLKTCTALQSKAAQAQQAVANLLQTAMQAQNCASLSSGTSVTTTDFCTANPSLAGCTTTVVDCTSTAMANDTVCICAANPASAACITATAATSVTESASMANRITSTSGDVGDLYGTPDITQAPLNKTAAEAAIDGKQGSGTSFGSGGTGDNSAAAARTGKSADSADATSVNSGFYGGGGGGSSIGGSSRGEGGVQYKMEPAAAAANPQGTDLRKFLPGGQFDPTARGIAGASGVDGITGPNSDIWQKVKNRYRIVTPSLMP